MTVKSEKDWIQQRYEANQALGKIETQRRAEENKVLMGKCYRYRNSYGSGSGWWLYARVIGVRDGWPVMFRFETIENNEIRIQPTETHVGVPDSSYQPITEAAFTKAWRALQKHIATTKPAVLAKKRRES